MTPSRSTSSAAEAVQQQAMITALIQAAKQEAVEE
jgi:hypothetical protein